MKKLSFLLPAAIGGSLIAIGVGRTVTDPLSYWVISIPLCITWGAFCGYVVAKFLNK